jgi:hypothetical protein
MTEKIAFLFLTRGEVNNVKLWESFFENIDTSKYKIVIHAKNPTTLTSPLWTGKNSTIIKPIPTAWGTISLVKATIYLLQTAIVDPQVTKFILVSEFCIPTTNFTTMYDCIIGEKHRSRINWTIGKNMDRYSIIKSYLNIPPHSWAKQSQWMCLDRKHVSILFSPLYNNVLNQQLKDFMYCPAPDEHFFINIFLYVIRIPSNEIINHPITFVDWSNNSKHPVAFNTVVKEVIETCRKNKIFFARKFVPMVISEETINYLFDINKIEEVPILEKPIHTIEEPIVIEEQITIEEPIVIEEQITIEEPITIEEQITIEEPIVMEQSIDTIEPEKSTVPIETFIVSDKQKQAVLTFFTNIVNGLTPNKIQTIYSALFDNETVKDVVEEPLDVVEESLDVIEESIDVVEEPLDVVEESLDIVEESLDIVEESLDVVEEPLDIVEESLDDEEI